MVGFESHRGQSERMKGGLNGMIQRKGDGALVASVAEIPHYEHSHGVGSWGSGLGRPCLWEERREVEEDWRTGEVIGLQSIDGARAMEGHRIGLVQ